jgi:hypothetical protein
MVGNVAHVAKKRIAYNILVGKLEGMRPLEDIGVDGKVLFKWILQICYDRVLTGFIWCRTGVGGAVAGSYKHQPSCFIKWREFRDWESIGFRQGLCCIKLVC